MQAPKPRHLPRKVTLSLLRLYIVLGLASIGIGVNLCTMAYHMRVVDAIDAAQMAGESLREEDGAVLAASAAERCGPAGDEYLATYS